MDVVSALLVAWVAPAMFRSGVEGLAGPPLTDADVDDALDELVNDARQWMPAGRARVRNGELQLPALPAEEGVRRLDLLIGTGQEVSIAGSADLRTTVALEGPEDEEYARRLARLIDDGATVHISYLTSVTVRGRSLPLDTEDVRVSLVEALADRARAVGRWDVRSPAP